MLLGSSHQGGEDGTYM